MRSINIVVIIYLVTACSNIDAQIVDRELNREDLFLNAKKEYLVERYDKALEILQKLYKQDRTNPTVNFEMAKIYDALGNYEQSEKHYLASLENDFENEWILRSYILHLEKRERNEDALKYLRKIIKLSPKDKSLYLKLADKLAALGRINEIPSVFTNLIENTCKCRENYELLLDAYIAADDHEKAMELFEKLLAESPKEVKYLKKKAQYHALRRETELAEDLYRKILLLNPDDTEANLFILNKSNGEDQNAYLRSLLPIIKNKSISIDIKVKELMPYVENLAKGANDDLREALMTVGEQLTLTHPDEAKAWAIAGDIFINAGATESAVKKYEKTIQLNPRNFLVWEQLMYGIYELSDYEKLKTIASDAIDRFPNQAICYFFASMAYMRLKEYSKAQILLDEALEVLPLNDMQLSNFYAIKATISAYTGDENTSKKWFSEALSSSMQKNPLVFELLGDVEFSKGDLQKAKANWEKALILQPNNKQLISKIQSI